MKWLIAPISALWVLLGALALIYGLEIGSLHSQLAQIRAQLTQQQRTGHAVQVSLSGELTRAESALTAAEARIGGTHRDLITCADWQGLVLPVSGSDSFGGQLAAAAGPASLPAHCINQ